MISNEQAQGFLGTIDTLREELGSILGGLDDLELQVREAIGPCTINPRRVRAANGDAGDELAPTDARAIFAAPDNWR